MRRLGFVSGLLLALAFAAPAFESHACAAEPASAQALAVADASTGDDQQCPDCGPACANGCCHAPHAAVPPESLPPRTPRLFATPAAPIDAVGRPLKRPDGPERPPRS